LEITQIAKCVKRSLSTVAKRYFVIVVLRSVK